jgi:hypothetical protein
MLLEDADGLTSGGRLMAAAVEPGIDGVLATTGGELTTGDLISAAAGFATTGGEVTTGVLAAAAALLPGSALVIAGCGVTTAGDVAAASKLAAGGVSAADGFTAAGLLTMTGTSTAGLTRAPTIRGVSDLRFQFDPEDSAPSDKGSSISDCREHRHVRKRHSLEAVMNPPRVMLSPS